VFDSINTTPQIYTQGGDFAVATLIATPYGLAALNRAGQDPTQKAVSLRADCPAGAQAANLLLENRPSSRYHLSPGDLDKAVSGAKACLTR
jgi:hypothetical protein